jgi:hypothetical protein
MVVLPVAGKDFAPDYREFANHRATRGGERDVNSAYKILAPAAPEERVPRNDQIGPVFVVANS